MAEKEQRIWLEFDIPKPKGAVEATRCTTMTRQEAINRIEKVLEEGWWRGKTFRQLSEAALNALLGESND